MKNPITLFFPASHSAKVQGFHWQVPTIEESCNELHEQYRKGDEKAKEKIILKCVPMAILIAVRFDPPPPYDIDDLVTEGIFGIMRAIEKFRPELGFSFTTYAAWWIYGFITRFIHSHQSPDCESVETIMDLLTGTEAVEEIPHGTFDDLIDSDFDTMLENQLDLTKILSLVHGRERKILEGLLEQKSLRTIAKEWSISGQRVSQIYHRVIRAIQNQLQKNNINADRREIWKRKLL
ncbi:hypothetical protein DRP04_00855 [Archaeoglobales archaeon]|nr:MAG: hypothetical protein DRP04_00855 [Archaeoglobales archaeon]